MFHYNEALSASTVYFGSDDLAAKVFLDKYALRDADLNLLERTPTDMHRRIAKEFARIQKQKYKNKSIVPLHEDEIFELLDRFKYIVPQGGPMYGIGNKHQYVTLSNCFVIDSPLDSYGGIMYADEHLVQISKRRGGVGLCLDNLRPENSPTRNSSQTSTGIISWMKRYSNSIREVGQHGRRGALMLTLNVHHPQILDFVSAKQNDTEITGANISVMLTNEFMNAVVNNLDYEVRWPVKIESGVSPKISDTTSARKVWHAIVSNAHAHAEPGLLFWDNVLDESPADCYADWGFKTISTNPCSELPLPANDSCRLLIVPLMAFVKDPFTRKATFDYQHFFETCKTAQLLMDDIIDLEIECIDRIIKKVKDDPEPDDVKQRELRLWDMIKVKCEAGRRTGLNITGLGDCLAALGFKYGSSRSIEEVEKIYRTLKFASYLTSVEMAEDLGPFPLWDWKHEKDNPFIKRIGEEDLLDVGIELKGSEIIKRIKKSGRRNIANLTQAPAGSVSIVCQCTSGIEPAIWLEFERKKKGNPSDEGFRTDSVDQSGDHWMHFQVKHKGYEDWAKINDIDIYESTVVSPYDGALANDLNWKQRVKLQAAAQQHIDHGISSTINLPSDVTVKQVQEIYEEAWRQGLKGVTVYREGSRTGVIVRAEEPLIDKRPKKLPCDVHHITVKGVKYFVLVGMNEGEPYEVFAGKNGFLPSGIKHGSIIRTKKSVYKAIFDDDDDDEPTELSPITNSCTEQEETITRLTSALLRSGANMHLVVQQLEKVGGDMQGFAKSVSRALKKHIPDGTKEGVSCPDCGCENVVRQEGCINCQACGWSKCN